MQMYEKIGASGMKQAEIRRLRTQMEEMHIILINQKFGVFLEWWIFLFLVLSM